MLVICLFVYLELVESTKCCMAEKDKQASKYISTPELRTIFTTSGGCILESLVLRLSFLTTAKPVKAIIPFNSSRLQNQQVTLTTSHTYYTPL